VQTDHQAHEAGHPFSKRKPPHLPELAHHVPQEALLVAAPQLREQGLLVRELLVEGAHRDGG
jgi:hypothetical protein